MNKPLKSLTVIVPAKNEASNLQNLILRLDSAAQKSPFPVILCIIDDGSTDSTREIFAKTKTNFIQTKMISNKKSLGIYEAWKLGIHSTDSELVAFMDGDLQNRPEDVFNLLASHSDYKAEVIQGRRINLEGLERSRSFYSKGLAIFLRWVSGTALTDPKSGFLLGDREAFEAALPKIANFKYPQSFIAIAMERSGFSVEEIPTGFDRRVAGESFLKGKFLVTITQSVLDVFFRYPKYRIKNALKVDPLRDWTPLQKIQLRIYFLTISFHGWIIRRTTHEKLMALLSSQWDSYEKIKRRREISLRDILNHAAKNTVWYSKTLSTKVGPSSQWKQLDGVPLLEKVDIKTNGPIQFMDFNNSYISHKIATSGSTGSPMIIFADREQLEWRFAATLRALTWTGWKIGKKQLRLWHQKIGMTRSQVYKEKLDAFLLRRKFVPAFEFNEEKVEELFQLIEKYKPFIIDGYAESFDYLTKHERLIQHKTGAVMSSAQTLTSQVRLKLENQLTQKVYDKYGSREFSGIAYECGKGPWFHVVSECYIIEILDSELNQVHPGQTGEIVVTDLKNKVMPMIRYRIGDIATAVDETKPCECGRESQRIGAIAGRTAALILTPLGRTLPGTFFAHFFKDYEEIVNQFQIIQESSHEIKVKIVQGRSWNEEAFKQLLEDLNKFLDGLGVVIDFVSVIPLGRTGKRSPVISMLGK